MIWPVIALGQPAEEDGAPTVRVFAVAMPALDAVRIYWIEAGRLVDAVTISSDVAVATLAALSGALETFERAAAMAAPESTRG